MDSSNHWYAHAHILAEYCGLDPEHPPRIDGVLQHGWTFVHGFGHGHRPPWGSTKYVWSDVSRRRGHLIGWRDYVTIGAPMLYLDRLVPVEQPDRSRRGTIWYPFHGTADYESVEGNHADLIAQIRDVESGPVTVCLYHVEYDQPAVRREYEEAGFRVICHGHRGTKWRGTDRWFLRRQLHELRRHERVASNRLSTAVMYGAALGCVPAVYGDPMEFVGVKAGFNGEGLLQSLYPEFFGTSTDPHTTRTIAQRELGTDHLTTPEELRLLLGWQDTWRQSSN